MRRGRRGPSLLATAVVVGGTTAVVSSSMQKKGAQQQAAAQQEAAQQQQMTDLQTQQAVRSWMRAQEPLADQPQQEGGRQGQFQTGGGLALIRIHDITSQLAAELGASVEAPHLAGAN